MARLIEVSVVALLCIACATAAVGAPADDPPDALNFVLGSSLRYEDNLFRLPSSADPQVVLGKPGKSDLITTTYGGITFDKVYSLQRFQLDATIKHNSYRTFDYLDFVGKDYHATWLWALTPRFTGNISLAQEQNETSYADFRNFLTGNVYTSKTQRLNGDWWVTGGWHLTGGADRTTVSNSAVFVAVGDTSLNSAEGGIKYVAASENFVSVVQRESHGEYLGRIPNAVNQLDNRFDQSETRIRVSKRIDGVSTFNAQAGYLSRKHEHFPQRNFDGVVGWVNYFWTPREKLQFNLSAARYLASYQEAADSYYLSQSVGLTSTWLISAKIKASLRLDRENRDYLGAIVPTPSLREDRINSAQLNIDWKPARTVILSAGLQRAQRSTNFTNFEYTANSASLTAQLKF